MTERSLTHTRLAGLFDVEVTVESTARHKPLPDPVFFALDALALPAASAVFVGDSTHDMHAGKAAGVRTAAATWGPFSTEELETAGPTWWLRSMGELRPIIEAMEQEA
jgi:pyrophosphatase PpaX